ncbi:cyanate hydratase [Lasius niger]|uniref:Cyanate hydratase n=1 Tax=Lasius niger TaxID=67767 RepID=A0A0J7KVV3_LASNI|nr:cyanate hydratase [Lasius niger]
MPISRNDVTEKIITAKANHNLDWADIAFQIGAKKGKTVAGCLGQAIFPPQQAEMLAKIFDLNEEEEKLLTLPPEPYAPHEFKDDPLMISLHKIINLYGVAIKEMVSDSLGEGTFKIHDLNIETYLNNSDDSQHVQISLDTKFLPKE